MRPNRLPSPTGGLLVLVASLCQLDQTAHAADDSKTDAREDRMAAIVAAVRAEEAKYRDLEYVVKITSRVANPQAPDQAREVTSLETRRVVLQADRLYCRKEAFERLVATKVHLEELSAYDGERTRTVVAGNCVNIHPGRFEHPDVYPAHCLPLAHFNVNFPLSVYLSGTDAIHAHPKYPRFFNREGGGSIYEFPKVVTRFEGEEKVDGLNCVKVRVDRWSSLKNFPVRQYLWLATERNYFCVKEQESRPQSRYGEMTFHEMHVDNLNELAPGLWFPKKFTAVYYDFEAMEQRRQVVSGDYETVVETLELAPRYNDAFFHDIAIPVGLPVFTIKDRTLLGSKMPEPIGGDQEKTKLAEVVSRVAKEEKRYDDLEVTAGVDYQAVTLIPRMGDIVAHSSREDRSVLRGSLAYFTSHERLAALNGQQSEQFQVQALDGHWTRGLHQSEENGQEFPVWASLSKGGKEKAKGRHDGVPVYRPHTLMQRDDWIYGPLADLLVSGWYDKINKYRLRFRYCGEGEFEGHHCIKLRGDVLIGERVQPHNSIVLFLATDRNLIPIKIEDYGGNFVYNAMPTAVSRCDDFREIAPGTWYPFRVTEVAFDNGVPTAQGRVLLNWRRAYQIKSVTPSPEVPNALFHDVIVPRGTKVQVYDEDRNDLGEYEQLQDGVAEVTPARYLELWSQAKGRKENKRK